MTPYLVAALVALLVRAHYRAEADALRVTLREQQDYLDARHRDLMECYRVIHRQRAQLGRYAERN
jgi:hypothetical protein